MRIAGALLIALTLTLAVAVSACGDDERDPSPAAPRVATIVQDDAELLHRTPQRIAATLDDPDEAAVNDEIRDLFAALAN